MEKTIRVEALKDHFYWGKDRTKGEQYDARETDMNILGIVGAARPVEVKADEVREEPKHKLGSKRKAGR